ncbi:Hypothetical predicted protein [Olea europaea subsp. europaea]|uniref:Uncharacterized protein n=1 Tax=Olea europaea subsp. europaea TaxID=158383 RepID=A0A8S0SFP0_OLEEU|nr:Hypothetical predicted protein [Olea europaea subsp. europaea]
MRPKTPIVKDPKGILPSESIVIWAEVSQAILQKCWEKAREAKSVVEEKQREVAKERKLKDENWVAKHFTVSHSKESGWECLLNHKLVPSTPIVVSPYH